MSHEGDGGTCKMVSKIEPTNIGTGIFEIDQEKVIRTLSQQ
jgi:hypothetical protein